MTLRTIDSRNIKEARLSVAYGALKKSGKTHNAFSWPEPIVSLYPDPNTETVRGFILEGRKIQLYVPSNFQEIENEFLPMVVNRKFDANTIVIDSYSFVDVLLNSDYCGASGDRKITIAEWGAIRSRHMKLVNQLLTATKPIPGKPAYHLVVTAHLSDVLDDKGAVVATRPAIQGGFKDIFGRCFGSLFYCEAKTVRPVTGTTLGPPEVQYRVHTVPPNERIACGDGVGGKGGYKRLPPVLEGTYSSLCKAWGKDPTAATPLVPASSDIDSLLPDPATATVKA